MKENLTFTYFYQIHTNAVQVENKNESVKIPDYDKVGDCGKNVNFLIKRNQIINSPCDFVIAVLNENLEDNQLLNLSLAYYLVSTNVSLLMVGKVVRFNTRLSSSLVNRRAGEIGVTYCAVIAVVEDMPRIEIVDIRISPSTAWVIINS